MYGDSDPCCFVPRITGFKILTILMMLDAAYGTYFGITGDTSQIYFMIPVYISVIMQLYWLCGRDEGKGRISLTISMAIQFVYSVGLLIAVIGIIIWNYSQDNDKNSELWDNKFETSMKLAFLTIWPFLQFYWTK